MAIWLALRREHRVLERIAGADRSTNCYYLDGSADCYCTALSTIKNNLHNSQMKTEEAFVGFDFNNVWIVDANSDYPYPQLKNNLQSDETPVRHNYSETILVNSTCTKLGLKKLFCTDCGGSGQRCHAGGCAAAPGNGQR